eukprot:1460061-Prymnesium_polylepis.1
MAIDEINNSSELLPGWVLSLAVRDSRRDYTAAFFGALELTTSEHSSCNATTQPVLAIIGAASSSSTAAAVRVASLSEVPLVSYSSTSPTLSRGLEYPFFARTVPADDYAGRALVEFVSLVLSYTHAVSYTHLRAHETLMNL